MRHRKTDAHIATIRVSVPIDPMDVATISRASAAISGMLGHGIFPPGTTIEVLNSRFGRVDAPVAAPAQGVITGIIVTNGGPGSEHNKTEAVVSHPDGSQTTERLPIPDAMAAIRDAVVSAGDGMDPPEHLRRVPRPAPNGGA